MFSANRITCAGILSSSKKFVAGFVVATIAFSSLAYASAPISIISTDNPNRTKFTSDYVSRIDQVVLGIYQKGSTLTGQQYATYISSVSDGIRALASSSDYSSNTEIQNITNYITYELTSERRRLASGDTFLSDFSNVVNGAYATASSQTTTTTATQGTTGTTQVTRENRDDRAYVSTSVVGPNTSTTTSVVGPTSGATSNAAYAMNFTVVGAPYNASGIVPGYTVRKGDTVNVNFSLGGGIKACDCHINTGNGWVTCQARNNIFDMYNGPTSRNGSLALTVPDSSSISAFEARFLCLNDANQTTVNTISIPLASASSTAVVGPTSSTTTTVGPASRTATVVGPTTAVNTAVINTAKALLESGKLQEGYNALRSTGMNDQQVTNWYNQTYGQNISAADVTAKFSAGYVSATTGGAIPSTVVVGPTTSAVVVGPTSSTTSTSTVVVGPTSSTAVVGPTTVTTPSPEQARYDTIRTYITDNNLTGQQIYDAARQYGVSAADLSHSMGWSVADIDTWTQSQGLAPLPR